MKEFKFIEIHHVVRTQNQEADALVKEQLNTVVVNVVALPKFNGAQHLQDVISYLEIGKFLARMDKGQQKWLVKKAFRF